METSPDIRPFPKLNLLPPLGRSAPRAALRAIPVRTVIFVVIAAVSWCLAIVSVGVLMSWIKLPAWILGGWV